MEAPNFWGFKNNKEQIKNMYADPHNLIEIEFANNTNSKKFVWDEPTCISLELDAETEYKMLTHERTFRIEFDSDETMTLYLQYSFGFVLYKRSTSKKGHNPAEWLLDIDCSDIN